MDSLSIIHENILTIGKDYHLVKFNIQEKLNEWSDLYVFNDAHNQIKYKTEGPLIPEDNGKIPILILLSNPHPHSVKQGMFLSPNRIGRENPFWDTLKGTGYFNFDGKIDAAVMVKNKYQSPFRFFMAVLLPFPSEDPKDLITILGNYEYDKIFKIAVTNINNLICTHQIKSVICFGKLQYDSLCQRKCPTNYTSILKQGNIITKYISSLNSYNLFLTYPTGWRFIKDFNRYKIDSLRQILNNSK
jgi:hypothetical protein